MSSNIGVLPKERNEKMNNNCIKDMNFNCVKDETSVAKEITFYHLENNANEFQVSISKLTYR